MFLSAPCYSQMHLTNLNSRRALECILNYPTFIQFAFILCTAWHYLSELMRYQRKLSLESCKKTLTVKLPATTKEQITPYTFLSELFGYLVRMNRAQLYIVDITVMIGQTGNSRALWEHFTGFYMLIPRLLLWHSSWLLSGCSSEARAAGVCIRLTQFLSASQWHILFDNVLFYVAVEEGNPMRNV